uniref:Spermatophylax protein 4a n=1 Tax=Gryllodes sigillatus TaxID=13551 RepID=A0A0P0AK01_9ORTH|nr:spermatophylax protein 4a [Gryllodes sigillatus]
MASHARFCSPALALLVAVAAVAVVAPNSLGVKGDNSEISAKNCVPGSSFKSSDGCNDCTCAADGSSVCTLRACLPGPVEAERCVPGSSFRASDGCNHCTCSKSGIPTCTRMACIPGLP